MNVMPPACPKQFFLLMFVLFALLFIPPSAVAEPANETLGSLKDRFQNLYECPGDRGLASFVGEVSCQQLSTIAQSMKLPIPEMTMVFQGGQQVKVMTNSAGENKGSPINDFRDGIMQSVEGFWQNYLTIGCFNLIKEIPGSATISVGSGCTVIDYPDRVPNHFGSLVFDGDFRLVKMVAKDTTSGFQSVLTPTWEKKDGRWVLDSLQTEFFSAGENTSNFLTRLKIENKKTNEFYLPSLVTMQARDGPPGKTSSVFLDFTLGPYRIASDSNSR